MSYTPPIADAVQFQFSFAAYTPPLWNEVSFDFNVGETGIASGEILLLGEAWGNHRDVFPDGSAAGEVPLSGEAVGLFVAPVAGVALGEILTGEAIGVVGASGRFVGALSFYGSEIGVRVVVGYCAGNLKLSGEAVGALGNVAVADGVLEFTGSQQGDFYRATHGVAIGEIPLNGAAFGYTPYLVDEPDSIYVRTKPNRIEARL